RGRRPVLAPRADRAQRERIAELGGDVHRETIGFDVLRRVVEPAATVEYVVEHRLVGREAGDQAVAAARIALVLRIIARDADQHRLAIAAELDGAARRPDVLVVIFEARGE